MTGRAAGFCAGFSVPGHANSAGGRGYGRGRGGRGRGRGWARAGYEFPAQVAPAPTAGQELEELKQQAEFLQSNLSQISERMKQLEKENEK